MIINNDDVKSIYFCTARVDFRKQIDGLVSYITGVFDGNVLDRSLFVFVSGDHKKLKMIYYDGSGFWMLMKRMEKGKFKYVFGEERQLKTISKTQLSFLLEGLEFNNLNQNKVDKINNISYLL